MKSATLFLVSVLVFLFTAPSLSTSILDTDDELVLDFYGHPLEKDVGYFLSLPGSRGAGGRVMLTLPVVQNNDTCEADVVLVRVIPINGTPFTFTPVNGKDDIKLHSGLAIQSPTRNPCGDSTIWKISNRDGLFNPIITTGGLFNTRQSCFRIIKSQSPFMDTLYSFQYCQGVCGPTKEGKICWAVGTTRSERGEHLSVGGSPLWFHFFRNTGFTAKM